MKSADKIKILYMSHFGELKMGGQKSMLALINNLNRERYEPFAVVPYEGELSDALEKVGCRCFSMPLKALKPKFFFHQLSNLIKLCRIIRREKIDIIHPDHERDAVLAGLACKFTKASMVWHVRLTRKVATDKITYGIADKVVGIAEDVRNRFDYVLNGDNKYQTVYNGVDCELFTPMDKPTIKSKLGLDPNDIIITYAGQLKPGKGVLDFIGASSEISVSNYCIILIGESDNEVFYNSMKKALESANTKNNIMILPFQKNIHEWFAASDIVVLPSHEGTEGMGRVLFEAMACGTAVIGTNISGVRQAITPDTGILVPEKSPEAIAAAINILTSDEKIRNSFAQNGRTRALAYFDIKKHARQIEKIYESILNNHVQ